MQRPASIAGKEKRWGNTRARVVIIRRCQVVGASGTRTGGTGVRELQVCGHVT